MTGYVVVECLRCGTKHPQRVPGTVAMETCGDCGFDFDGAYRITEVFK